MPDSVDFCDLKNLLTVSSPPYFLVAEGSSYDISDVLRKITYDLNWSIDYRKVDGKRMDSLEGIFNEFSAAYQFPEYFGHNLDAFDECMNDLDWINANAFVLLLMNFDEMIVNNKAEDIKILIKTLFNTCLNWKDGSEDGFQKSGTPFHIIFHTNTDLNKANGQLFELICIELASINVTDCMRSYKLTPPC